ncbi:metallophosphoesterase family protein [uncultured Aliiroseovarius sp.]|uniref:metallophosphoesterase family protein n=1 Tax=uncultured Aliiroseovarius sp. TaxID=1658783 RepID=UPI0026289B9C|nr:metallophosphoesterase family protein [uncultured Aliiroseovarius sp.]
MSLLKRLTQRWAKEEPPQFDAELQPDRPFFVVGDLHGQAALLKDVLQWVDGRAHDARTPIVFVGDYVDRGPDSAGVLKQLRAYQEQSFRDVICLCGNHEDMMLSFLDDPLTFGRVWFGNGGVETLKSFGVDTARGNLVGAQVTQTRDLLLKAMGDDLVDWIRALPVQWYSGNVSVVHAGADPSRRMDAQDRNTLVWGHADFLSSVRRDGRWVVHGHTIVPEVTVNDGRIAVDTGAYKTGNLAVVRIDHDEAAVFA